MFEKSNGFFKVKLPLCIDIEYTEEFTSYYDTMTKDEMTSLVKSFALTISKKGYVPCLYLDREYLTSKYNMNELGDLPLWYARWRREEAVAHKECPAAFFWQKDSLDVEGVKWDGTQSSSTYVNKSWWPIYILNTSEEAIYDYIQTKTDSNVYVDYCKKIAYVPKGYTAKQIEASLRPLPGTEFWYSIRCDAPDPTSNYIGIMDSMAMRQRFEIVRV